MPFGVILERQLLQVAGILRPMNLPRIYNPITCIIKIEAVSFEFVEFGLVIKMTASGTTIGSKSSKKITTLIWKLALIGDSYFCITLSSAAVCKLCVVEYFCEAKPQKRNLQTVQCRRSRNDAGTPCYVLFFTEFLKAKFPPEYSELPVTSSQSK